MEDKLLQIKKYLYKILSNELSNDKFSLIENQIKSITSSNDSIKIHQLFSRIPSLIGKLKINFTKILLEEASCIRPGWNPENLRVDQAARITLLLSLPTNDPIKYKKYLQNFFETADVNELETLCLGLPLYPHPEQYTELVKFGLRSNIKIVFEAIALNNPYPAEYLDINAWNQMVLKAIFIGSPVYKICGVDERANENLSRMVNDYAHERWAAGRTITPEIWRLIGASFNEAILDEIQTIFSSHEYIQQEAIALACLVSKEPNIVQLLESNSELKNKIINGNLSWESVAENWNRIKETL